MLVIVVKEWISTKKALLTKQDIRNIKVKVDDRMIKCHEEDASSVIVMMAELQQKSYTPILFFKPHKKMDSYQNKHLFLSFKWSSRRNYIQSMLPQSRVLIQLMAQISINLNSFAQQCSR